MKTRGLSQVLTGDRECDREKIHTISSIQPHGCLLAFDPSDYRVQVVSENAEAFLQHPLDFCLQTRLSRLIPPSVFNRVTALVEQHPWSGLFGRSFYDQRAGLDAYLYFSDGLFVLEIEKIQDESAIFDGESILKDFSMKAKEISDARELGQLACRRLRDIIGMDRVMMYQFLPPQMHGEVIAEDRIANSHSYLNHRFPASDIPAPARALYMRNQVRLIPDTVAAPVGLRPDKNPLTNAVIDLSDSRLRAVAPVHLEYLRNMKVGASFSISITIQGRLWGLFACHSEQPILISQTRRSFAEILVHGLAANIMRIEETEKVQGAYQLQKSVQAIFEELRSSIRPVADFLAGFDRIHQAFKVSGVALVGAKDCEIVGSTPPREFLGKMREVFLQRLRKDNSPVLVVEGLREIEPEWEALNPLVAGALVSEVDEVEHRLLIFFRPEYIRSVTWGGDPRKNLNKRDYQGRLNPRESFQSWNEEIKFSSLPWRDYEIESFRFLAASVFGCLARHRNLVDELSTRIQKPE